jgi:hypothetical protein
MTYGSATDTPNHTFVGNVITTSNVVSGNVVVTQNISTGNVSSANLVATQNTTTGNISVTQNASFGNASVTQNVSAGNGTFSGAVTIAGNLIVNGTTITLNASSVQTNDQYIMLASNNNLGDTIDYGFAALSKNTTQGNVYSGLVKHIADETWHLFDGYALMNAYPATINTAQTNVATLNANIIAAQINVVTLNASTQILQFANSGVYVAGTLVANNPNINFVAANTSNLSITGTSNTSPGNVTITIDTRNPPGGTGGGSVNAYANSGLVAASLDNIVWLNSASILYVVTQNASETKAVNVQPSVNSTLNLVSLNVSANISNVGNLLITQNTFTGNISVATLANVVTLNVSANIANVGNLLVTQNTFTGNLSVTQNSTFGNVVFSNANTAGSLNVTGNLVVNTLSIVVGTTTLATVTQTALDNFVPALTATGGGLASVEYTVQANCANSFHLTKIMILTDGTNVFMDEYGTLFNNGPVGTLTAGITAGNGQLLWTSNNATSTIIKTARYGILA